MFFFICGLRNDAVSRTIQCQMVLSLVNNQL
jgi:hypothetical protein